jgi:hypothetical protein
MFQFKKKGAGANQKKKLELILYYLEAVLKPTGKIMFSLSVGLSLETGTGKLKL